jgi:hypothetical protein
VDKIFSDIKRAIEEELAQQEATRQPGQRGTIRTIPQRPPVQPRDDGWDDQRETRDADEAARVQARRERDTRRSASGQRETHAARQAAEASRRREDILERAQDRGGPQRTRRQQPDEGARRASAMRSFIQETFRTTEGLRRAIILSEVFGRPVSMRRPDDHLP